MKSFVVLAILGLFAVNSAYGLNCYQCINCEDVKDELKKECKEDLLDQYPADIPSSPSTTQSTASPTTQSTASPTTQSTASPTTQSTASPTTQSTASQSTDAPAPTNKGQELKSKFIRDVRADEYKCVKTSIKVGEGEMTVRGCTKKECKTGTLVKKCDTCEGETCNFAPGMKSWAVSSIVLLAVIKMFL